MGVDIFQVRIEGTELVFLGGAGIQLRDGVRIGFARFGFLDIAAALVALQQRIAFQLAFDIGLQLEIGHLQQLDGLLQLRGHDQGLALAQIHPLRQCHG